MATVTTRTQLGEHAFRALGAPVIEINVDDDQLEDRIDDALQFYQEYHSDAIQRVYYKHQLLAADVTNSYIELPNTITSIVRLLDMGQGGSVESLFNVNYHMRLQDMWNMSAAGSKNLQLYTQRMSHLALLDDRLNSTEPGHILTLEDPVEFMHPHKMSLVNQREIGVDTLTFHNGLRSLLRQDPDIVLVGELRDVETIEAALEIAETGHLVFGTLHTNSTIQTISRIINVFPADQQEPIRTLLSFVLQGVVAQQLLPKKGGGRVLCQEILRMTPAIRNLVREDKLHQVYSQMQIAQEETKMVTMNQSIKKALDSGYITREDALSYSNNPEEMQKMLGIRD